MKDLEPRLRKFNTEKNIVSHNTLKKEDYLKLFLLIFLISFMFSKLRNKIYIDDPLYKNNNTNCIRTPTEKKNKAPNAKVSTVKKVANKAK